MSKERLSMRKVKEILRLKHLGLSNRQIALSIKVSHSTIADYLRRAEKANISWPIPKDLDDSALARMLFSEEETKPRLRVEPDYGVMHKELKKRGVSLMLLWEEYISSHPDGYRYSQFCYLYRNWEGHIEPTLRQHHKAGEKMFADYAGMSMPVVDRDSGEVREAQIFVVALGASNYTYAEATWTQELPNFIGSHVRAFSFFGGVPRVVVPDNPKQGVSKACYYDPDINPTYQDMATYYGIAIIPARPARPKDKAKVESAVEVVERWVLAPLRNRVFFSLSELNDAIFERLVELNERPFQKLDGSRRKMFLEIDKPALMPLPEKPYEFALWRKAKVNIDYHIEVEGSYYSVPYKLIGKRVDVRLTSEVVEILLNSKRIASHIRSHKRGTYSTVHEHRPKSHQRYLEWTPSRIIAWAKETGEAAAELTQKIIESKPHPEQGYRACLGIVRLSKRYGKERVEAACRRALASGAVRYKSVRSILETGLDSSPLEESVEPTLIYHENLRGSNYYR
jgi:transposase